MLRAPFMQALADTLPAGIPLVFLSPPFPLQISGYTTWALVSWLACDCINSIYIQVLPDNHGYMYMVTGDSCIEVFMTSCPPVIKYSCIHSKCIHICKLYNLFTYWLVESWASSLDVISLCAAYIMRSLLDCTVCMMYMYKYITAILGESVWRALNTCMCGIGTWKCFYSVIT